MELQDIKAFFETEGTTDEDVKAYLQGLSKVTVEGVEQFSNSEDGKKWLQPKLDKNFTKGLDTWKTGNLQKLLDEAISKANPAETPEQKMIRDLTDRLNKKEADEKRQMLMNKGIMHADSKKLPKELVEFLLGDSEESTLANIDRLETIFSPYIAEQVTSKLGGSYKPSTDDNSGTKTTLSTQDLSSMSVDEINANWDKAK